MTSTVSLKIKSWSFQLKPRSHFSVCCKTSSLLRRPWHFDLETIIGLWSWNVLTERKKTKTGWFIFHKRISMRCRFARFDNEFCNIYLQEPELYPELKMIFAKKKVPISNFIFMLCSETSDKQLNFVLKTSWL